MCLLVSGSMYSLARPKSTMNITLSFFILVLQSKSKLELVKVTRF